MERQRLARLLLAALLPAGACAAAHAQETQAATDAATAKTVEQAAQTPAAQNAAQAPVAATPAAPAAPATPAVPATGTETPAAAPPAEPPAAAKPTVERTTEKVAQPPAERAAAERIADKPAEAAKDAAKPAARKPAPATGAGGPLKNVVAGSWRDPANVARDGYRHPLETLQFFGVRADQTVVEITPGGGWYSEILAPYLREKGRYVAAVVDPDSQTKDSSRAYFAKAKSGLEKKFAAAPAQYGGAVIAAYDPFKPAFGAPASADVVLTFRNVHNWRSAGQAEVMFKGFYDVLKPGGTLGVVEHRAKGDVPAEDKSGYVGQAQVIALAEAAGFRLEGKSEVNANPRDTKDYPNGVWTLPPSNQHEAADGAKYKAIGESDRMTLRFRKPR
ncbi:methyltransferase type 11 [Lysobacter enzymogenes]|uniref:Methyltransferase type 11 n=1 Tax=Lysobacter enzymogenes TaxID=69 RepID=A0A0S2DPR7_LYSEN|nr:methyltransferase type 11 [Lysobacter enzymogenes]